MYSTLSVVLYVCTYDAMVQEVHVHAEIVSSEPSSVPLHVHMYLDLFFYMTGEFWRFCLDKIFIKTNHLQWTLYVKFMIRDVFIGLTLAVKLWETTILPKHKI